MCQGARRRPAAAVSLAARSGKLDVACSRHSWGRCMRLIELSDHPAGMLRDTRQQRLAAQQRDQADYAAAWAQHEAWLDQARAERYEAFVKRRWWTWIRAVFVLWVH